VVECDCYPEIGMVQNACVKKELYELLQIIEMVNYLDFDYLTFMCMVSNYTFFQVPPILVDIPHLELEFTSLPI
jgi:hypothetical protein